MRGGGIVAEYTPKTESIREHYVSGGTRTSSLDAISSRRVYFDAWLAAHDLEVAKNAYKRGYADGLETGTADWP